LAGSSIIPVNVEHYCFIDKLGQFCDCEQKIKDLLSINRPVPAKLLKEYFELLNEPKNTFDGDINIEATAVKQKSLAFFAKRKAYQFNKKVKLHYEHPLGGTENYERVYSLDDLISGICSLLEAYLQLLGDKTKEAVIAFTYTHIKEYLAEIPQKKEVLTDYKIRVMTGFITANIGFNLTEKQFKENSKTFGTYTQFLADSVKYLAKKIAVNK